MERPEDAQYLPFALEYFVVRVDVVWFGFPSHESSLDRN